MKTENKFYFYVLACVFVMDMFLLNYWIMKQNIFLICWIQFCLCYVLVLIVDMLLYDKYTEKLEKELEWWKKLYRRG